jgi:2-polyprenyl-6-methoxyphenol hydroxylase-like FAD-dependent oxidoreductase
LSHLSPKRVLDKLVGVIWRGRQSGEWPYTLVESVDDGWFYSANLPGERATVVYLTDSDLYRQSGTQLPHLWWRQLRKTTHTCKRVPRNADLSKLRVISAASTTRLNPVGKGWCAVGDAAMSHDPLSGVGIHYALECALQAAPAIAQYLDSDEPLDSYQHWVASKVDRYLTARQYHYATEQRWPNSLFWQRRTFLRPSEVHTAI